MIAQRGIIMVPAQNYNVTLATKLTVRKQRTAEMVIGRHRSDVVSVKLSPKLMIPVNH